MSSASVKHIAVIWDNDNGEENEGWFTRTYFHDGGMEDRAIDEDADATDAELIERYSWDAVTAVVIR